ncbi:hypothetical protein SAMN06265222_108219 [Neorhodopirellula lusitana]|uniref:Uncharacterized protein n=1 Tax=Neorhodopirellula lusitana TaxID=445327 RepID=A0ABY1Q9K7_9BACT|nr:hypothetical protein SAMN06265222_108219 [Neorhodopirellula lusitana]
MIEVCGGDGALSARVTSAVCICTVVEAKRDGGLATPVRMLVPRRALILFYRQESVSISKIHAGWLNCKQALISFG